MHSLQHVAVACCAVLCHAPPLFPVLIFCLHFFDGIDSLTLLLKKLVRKGRIFLDSKKDLVYYAGITEANPAILSSFWVLLDFYPEVNYHTVSDYPVTLSFTATDDCFDVIDRKSTV